MLEKNYHKFFFFFIAGKTFYISSLFPLWVSLCFQLSSVQSVSCVWLFASPWTAAHQASLSITNFWSLLKLMSKGSVMPSNHIILCVPLYSCLQSFPASWSFPMSQFYASVAKVIGISTSASVLPMNIQDWFPLGWTGWVSMRSKGFTWTLCFTWFINLLISVFYLLYKFKIQKNFHWF